MFFESIDLRDEEIHLKLLRVTDEKPERAYLPAYYFSIMNEENLEVGKCDLRIGHNENTRFGGNIGYEVYPKYRGNNYAARACRLLFQLAKKHEMKEIYITCDPDNIASRKSCEIAGATLVEIVSIPSHLELYRLGKRESCIYKIEL